MQLFLGIDGGGTGCRAALADRTGRVLGRGVGGPANISVETDAALASILAATQAALAEAGQTGADPCNIRAALGLAGANVPEAAARLAALLPFAQSRIVSDSMTATVGALRGEDGIVAAIGTGSVFGVARNGKLRHFGGHGFVLGDEGSGAVLGRALLAEALRATDGFVPMTPLLRQVLDELGGPTGVIAFSLAARPVDFAQFAPRILANDDPAAEALFAASVLQVGAMIDHLQSDAPLPVFFLGGLGQFYAARLAGRWDIRPAKGTGLDGAVLLAIEGA